MANIHRGEVAFECGGVEYTMRLGANAICEIETLLDKTIADIAQELANSKTLRLSTVRAVVWAGLREKHPAIKLIDAGEIIQELGLSAAVEIMGKALNAAYEPKGNGAAHPTQPDTLGPQASPEAVGTGKGLSANGAN